jgi:hypothetical protein
LRRTSIVGIFANDAAIIPPVVGTLLLERDRHWQVDSAMVVRAPDNNQVSALLAVRPPTNSA